MPEGAFKMNTIRSKVQKASIINVIHSPHFTCLCTRPNVLQFTFQLDLSSGLWSRIEPMAVHLPVWGSRAWRVIRPTYATRGILYNTLSELASQLSTLPPPTSLSSEMRLPTIAATVAASFSLAQAGLISYGICQTGTPLLFRIERPLAQTAAA